MRWRTLLLLSGLVLLASCTAPAPLTDEDAVAREQRLEQALQRLAAEWTAMERAALPALTELAPGEGQ